MILRSHIIKKYFKNHQITKIHFGRGNNFFNGFLNTDIFAKIPIDITKRLPLKSDSVDYIYSNHIIEHTTSFKSEKFLKETLRILKPSGIHIIATPSLEKICKILYGKNKEKIKKRLIELNEKKLE